MPAASSMYCRRSSGRDWRISSRRPCPTIACRARPMPASDRTSWMSSRRHGRPPSRYSLSPDRKMVRLISISAAGTWIRPAELSMTSFTSAIPSWGRAGLPGEDHVGHLVSAEGPGALLAEHPRDGVDHVGLARAVRAHHDGDARSELEDGLVREGFESTKGQLAQEHFGTGCYRCKAGPDRPFGGPKSHPCDSTCGFASENPPQRGGCSSPPGECSARDPEARLAGGLLVHGLDARRPWPTSARSGTRPPWRRRRRAAPRTPPRPGRRTGSAPSRSGRGRRPPPGWTSGSRRPGRRRTPGRARASRSRPGGRLSSGTAGSSSCPGPEILTISIGVRHRRHGSPLRPYTLSSAANSPGLPYRSTYASSSSVVPRNRIASCTTSRSARYSRRTSWDESVSDIRSHRSPAANSTSSE